MAGSRTGNRSNSQAERVDAASVNRRRTFEMAIRAASTNVEADRFQTFILQQVTDCLVMLEQQFANFQSEHLRLVDDPAQADSVDAHFTLYTEINNVYSETRLKMTQRIAELTPPPPTPVQLPAQQQQQPQVLVNLKTADALSNLRNTWGTFDGDHSAWHAFRDAFKAAVHDKPVTEIPINDKFQYLQAAMRGAALESFGKWTITDDNYKKAWNRLIECYEDDYLAVQTLVRRLLAIPKLETPTYNGIRKIIDTVHQQLQQLSNFVDVSNWDPLIVFMVVDLLDPITHEAWENYREKTSLELQEANTASDMEVEDASGGEIAIDVETIAEGAAGGATGGQIAATPTPKRPKIYIPTWSQVNAFLETRARIMMHSQHRDHKNSGGSRDRSRDSNAGRQRPKGKPNAIAEQPQASGNRQPTGYPLCILCKFDHPLYRCSVFIGLNLNGRWVVVRENRLCALCLKAGHDVSQCKFPPCTRCPGNLKHNSLLCATREAERRTMLLQSNDVEMRQVEPAKFAEPPRKNRKNKHTKPTQ